MQFSPINQQGGINPRTKTYLQIGLFVGIGYIIYRVVKAEVAKNKILRGFGRKETIQNNTQGNTGGVILTQTDQCAGFNPQPAAEKIRDAMENNCYLIFGCTDEDTIYNTLESLTCDQRKCVRNYFNAMYGDGKTLFQWFDGDFSGSDLTRVKGYFDCDYVIPDKYL